MHRMHAPAVLTMGSSQLLPTARCTERWMKRLEGTLSHLRASACTGAAELITRDNAGAPPRASQTDASAAAAAELKLSAGELAQFNRVHPTPTHARLRFFYSYHLTKLTSPRGTGGLPCRALLGP